MFAVYLYILFEYKPNINLTCVHRDQTNQGMYDACADPKKVPEISARSCELVRADDSFHPSEFTVAVHMW